MRVKVVYFRPESSTKKNSQEKPTRKSKEKFSEPEEKKSPNLWETDSEDHWMSEKTSSLI